MVIKQISTQKIKINLNLRVGHRNRKSSNPFNGLNKRHKVAAAQLDVEKAFDKVWRNGLIYKLISLNVPNQLINIIKSFLTNRTFRITTDGKISSVKTIKAGVPQGSRLSPHLFSIHINDTPKTSNCDIALFADDTLFLRFEQH